MLIYQSWRDRAASCQAMPSRIWFFRVWLARNDLDGKQLVNTFCKWPRLAYLQSVINKLHDILLSDLAETGRGTGSGDGGKWEEKVSKRTKGKEMTGVKVRCRLSTISNSDFDSFACLSQKIQQLNVSLLVSLHLCRLFFAGDFFIGPVRLSQVCLSICVCLFPSSHFAVSVSLPCVVYFICCQPFSSAAGKIDFFFTRICICVWLLFCSLPVCQEDISLI